VNLEQARKLRPLQKLTLEQLNAHDPELGKLITEMAQRSAIRQHLAPLNLPPAVSEALDRLHPSELAKDLHGELRTALDHHGVKESAVRDILKAVPTAAPQASANTPVSGLPGVATAIAQSQVTDIVDIVELPKKAASAITASVAAPSALTDAALQSLIDRKQLTEQQARSTGLAASLYRVAGEDQALTTTIQKALLPSLGATADGAPALLKLAALRAADWSAFIVANKVVPPAGATADDLGETLAARFASLYPGAALVGRLSSLDAKQVSRDLETVAPLRQRSARVVGVPMSELSAGLPDVQLGELLASHERLSTLASTYSGMELAAVLDDQKIADADKVATVVRRIGYVTQTVQQLGEVSFLQMNLASDGTDIARLALNKLGASDAEQQMVVSTLKTYQRVWTVAQDVDTSLALVQAGFHSALSIARQTLPTFQAQIRMHGAQAAAIWERARTGLADVSLTAGALLDILHGLAGVYDNQSPSAQNYLKTLAGFQDLFGSLSLCSCDECQSILGPAAYFVDLMKFIDDTLRVQFPSTNHPLDLKTRRPDLWTLELSCDNTNNRVAVLDVVNPVLENAIAQRQGYGGSLADRTAVADFVYRQTLAVKQDSFAQPCVLPLARLASYLSQFQNTRSDVAGALALSISSIAQAELNLSATDYVLIATPKQQLADLAHLYGIAFSGAPAAVNQVDASALTVAMGLTREQLGDLIATWFVAAGGAAVSIVATKLNAQSVQNDVEWVRGLSVDSLDRMHRFTRLCRFTGWTIADLDLVLQTIGNAALDGVGIQTVAQVHAIVRQWILSTQDAAALIGALPMTPAGQSLFDQLFNAVADVASGGKFPKPSAHFVHPAFRQNTSAPIDPNLPRLLSGLNVNLDELASLARRLAPYLAQEVATSFSPTAANEDDRYFVLSAPNLSLLYRHARLARLLGLGVEDFFQLLGFAQLDHVTSLADLDVLLDIYEMYKEGNYKLDDIAVATGQAPRNPSLYLDPASVASAIVLDAAAGLTFKGTVFAVSLGTTEQGSADLIAANPGVIEALPNNLYRLVSGIDLAAAAISIPLSATVPTPPAGTRAVLASEVRSALQPYLASELLVRSLGTWLNVAREKVQALAQLSGQSLKADALTKAVRGDGPIASLAQFVAQLVPLAVIFADSVWDAAALGFVGTQPAIFGTGTLPVLVADAQHPRAPFVTLVQLRALTVYTRLANRRIGTSPNDAPVNPADIQAVLAAFVAATGFPSSSDASMSRVLNVPTGLIVGLRGKVTLPAVAASALGAFDRAAQMAAAFGIDGNTFAAIASADYVQLSNAADALVAVLRERIDVRNQTAVLEKLEQPVRAAKRDGLTDFLIHSVNPKIWTSRTELYEYYLIDVDAGGCQTTSLVVAATLSAQLYVYRALMNLEQDDLPPNNPAHFALTVPQEAALEWSWRKNYRVWQANRKVFLWPENFLIPDLRDDKSPLFVEIEQELLQTSLTDQDVLDAYTKYMAGFTEVATLTIAGAYHEIIATASEDATAQGAVGDVLHLFGCTADDPPVYYYRTCQNLIGGSRSATSGPLWSPWRKVSVQITSRRVAPVVHFGRLHVLWSDIKTGQKSTLSDGNNQFWGYKHQMTLRYTTLRPDGAWTAPQTLRLPPGPVQWQGNSSLLSDPSYSLFGPTRGMVMDPVGLVASAPPKPLLIINARYDSQLRDHSSPIDDYSLAGPNWSGIWPLSWSIGGAQGLEISYRNFTERRQVDLFTKTVFDLPNPWATDASAPYPPLLCAKTGGDTKPLYWGVPSWMPYSAAASANLVIEEERLDVAEKDMPGFKAVLTTGLYAQQIATIPAQSQMLAIPGSVQDGILQVGNDILLLQSSMTDAGQYVITRIGTTLIDTVARSLFEDGVDAILDTQAQLALAEAGLPIALVGSAITDKSGAGGVNYTAALGNYFRELYLYLPWLIAHSLNARGSYEAAHNWFRYIFDPTANEIIDVTGLSAAEAAHRVLDRVWRYREFRGLDLATLRDILTDPTAIALYKRDPFNPWAIARRRISAFQKAIVMGMVGNLLDWGDSLFTQFQMETVSEAFMLYKMAEDILGPRPVQLGDCGAGVKPDDYETIGPLIDSSSEILIELETWIIGWRYALLPPAITATYVLNPQVVNSAATRFPLTSVRAARVPPQPQPISAETLAAPVSEDAAKPGARRAAALAQQPGGTEKTLRPDTAGAGSSQSRASLFTGMDYGAVRTANWAPPMSNRAVRTADVVGSTRDAVRTRASHLPTHREDGLGRGFNHMAAKSSFAGWAGRFGFRVVTSLTPAFCVPANTQLLDYWDRVADRLYKIHHCQDINGDLRELALFAPPINPLQLVAMEAEGLSLDDVLGSSTGSLPPYRFIALIERAKAFAAALAGFGSSLLSALEKKDAEQLNRLRLTQQMNLAQLSTQARQAEIDAADAALAALNAQQDSAQYRSDFYAGLIGEDRTAGEITQTAAVHTSSGIKAMQAALELVGAILALTPELGSPFAMVYGGKALNTSVGRFAKSTACLASIAEAVGASAGLEATYQRRGEGWKNLKQLADYDLQVLGQQIKAATLRVQIATNALTVHQKSIAQTQALMDLAEERFTSMGLYTWLSAQLQTVYRGAYQNALAIAMLAQQAYRFERGEDTAAGLSFNYWDPAHSGLLAGEKLLFDLQTLERRYLETNYRTLEIDQPFPLSLIDPQALLTLRETGECTFAIAEVFADLFYPGTYRRRIKNVRLTIPCVTGPYVNVSATLTLVDSWVRPTANLGAALVEVPPSRSVSIATSTAQNDGGVFEMSFRDERYMPFEGLGVSSKWNLRLPKAFRPFDYQTINEAVVWISYTALQDDALRDRVEASNAALAGAIVNYFTNHPAQRLLSLRQDFSSAFVKLLRSPANTVIPISLSERNLPGFVKGRTLAVTRAALVFKTADGLVPAGLTMSVDGTTVPNPAPDATLGHLPTSALPAAFLANLYSTHSLVIAAAGNLAPAHPVPGDVSVVDAALLSDVMLYLEYRFQ
jgi:hypothetical protein